MKTQAKHPKPPSPLARALGDVISAKMIAAQLTSAPALEKETAKKRKKVGKSIIDRARRGEFAIDIDKLDGIAAAFGTTAGRLLDEAYERLGLISGSSRIEKDVPQREQLVRLVFEVLSVRSKRPEYAQGDADLLVDNYERLLNPRIDLAPPASISSEDRNGGERIRASKDASRGDRDHG